MAFNRTTTIQASPERVFSVLSDLGSARQWMPAIQKIDDVTPGPFRLGTCWQETRQAGKRTLQSRVSVSSFEPPSRLGLEVTSKPMRGQLSFSLARKGGATEVKYQAEMWGKGLMRLMTGTINRMMAEQDNDILDRLRMQVESRR
jgi:carbon monoxide dehydrogenase subunit G